MVPGTFTVRVAGRLTEADSAAFAAGLHLDDGLVCQPAELRVMTSGEESEAHVILREGKLPDNLNVHSLWHFQARCVFFISCG